MKKAGKEEREGKREEIERYGNSGENNFILYLNLVYLPRTITLLLLYFIVNMEI